MKGRNKLYDQRCPCRLNNIVQLPYNKITWILTMIMLNTILKHLSVSNQGMALGLRLWGGKKKDLNASGQAVPWNKSWYCSLVSGDQWFCIELAYYWIWLVCNHGYYLYSFQMVKVMQALYRHQVSKRLNRVTEILIVSLCAK